MSGKLWTTEENAILYENYGKSNKTELIKLLPNRTWDAIKLHAQSLQLKYYFGSHEYVQGNLSVLLDDTPISYYWMGFLLADGSFCNNRLKLHLASKDYQHVVKFARFIQCENYMLVKDGCQVAVKDVFVVPKILGKFDIHPRKTYNPPNISWMKTEFIVPFIIGFIDGDGSISFQTGRKDCSIKIKNHSSWINVLQLMADSVASLTKTNSLVAKINKQGYARINFCNSIAIKFLKKEALKLGLPILNRKWNKIDLQFIGRVEQAILNRHRVLEFKKLGVRNRDIAKIMMISESTVSIIAKELKHKGLV